MSRPGTIAVAARELEGPPRGVSRWLREVLAAWRKISPERSIVLYTEAAPPTDFDAAGFDVRPTGPGPRGGATGWEQVALARSLARDRPAVVLCPAYSIPLLTTTPAVVVLHDLSFVAHPEWFAFREGTRLRLLARWSAQRARHIIVDSEFTAREVATRYRVPSAKLTVIPLGVPAGFRPVTEAPRIADTRRRLGVEGTVVLAVGSMFTRRRIPELVAGFAQAARARPDLRLVLVGDNRTHPRLDVDGLLRDAGVADRTRWIERVSDPDLVTLYSTAAVAVYLSDYEGFGLPPLEALACGCPVLASASTSLIENLDGRATLLAPADHNAAGIARALAAILDRTEPRTRPDWVDGYSWQRTGERVLHTLEAAIR